MMAYPTSRRQVPPTMATPVAPWVDIDMQKRILKALDNDGYFSRGLLFK